MSLIEIILDASQLEYFEPCPRKWSYSHLLNLEPRISNKSFNDGLLWHEALAVFYSSKNPNFIERLREAIEHIKQTAPKYQFKKEEELKFHLTRFTEYCHHYMFEDEPLEVVAVEQGFSWLLYEDISRRYILEGKIDLIARVPNLGLTVIDHKTQSRQYEKWKFNHQVMNYFSFVKPNYFMYNYIGLQKKLTADSFRRPIYQPAPGMLDQWKAEVKKTFDEMYNYISNATIKENATPPEKVLIFPRRRAACTTQFGICQFAKLCSIPDNSPYIANVYSTYKQKEEKWRAWA